MTNLRMRDGSRSPGAGGPEAKFQRRRFEKKYVPPTQGGLSPLALCCGYVISMRLPEIDTQAEQGKAIHHKPTDHFQHGMALLDRHVSVGWVCQVLSRIGFGRSGGRGVNNCNPMCIFICALLK